MNRPPSLAPINLLTLARLLASSNKGETLVKLSNDLVPLVEHRWQGSAWAERLGRAVSELESAGAIDRVKDKKGKPTARLALTAEGRRLALEALGIEALPPKTTWAKLKSLYLVALALGRSGASAADAKWLSGASGLRAELLRGRFGLDLVERPTNKQVGEATAAKLLGLEAGERFTIDSILRKLLHDQGIDLPPGKKPSATAIQEAVFRRELGDTKAKKPLDLIVARSVGARQTSTAGLNQAAIRNWIDRSEAIPAAPERAGVLDLPDFARRVAETARESPSGWFGDGKVFISHVWSVLRDHPDFRGCDADAFKARLIEAHRARLIELGRADLVEAMSPADVRESATPYLNAVYHFVRTEEPA